MLYLYKIILMLPLMFPNIPTIFPTIFPLFTFSFFSFSLFPSQRNPFSIFSHFSHLFNISFYIFMTSDYLLYHKSCDLSYDLYFHYYFIFQVQVLFALVYYLDNLLYFHYISLTISTIIYHHLSPILS